MKNGTIIFQNVPDEKDVIGSLYRFTKDGILFSYMMGEGLGCGSFSATYYTYYNLPTGKLFYSVYIDSER